MQVTVPRPDVKGRTEILKWYLKKIKVDPGTEHPYIHTTMHNKPQEHTAAV